MRPAICTTRFARFASRCAELFADGQRLDAHHQRSVRHSLGGTGDADIGDDLPGHGELRLADSVRETLQKRIGAGAGDPQVDPMAFAGEGQRLPVSRLDGAKQKPIAVRTSADEQGAEQPGGTTSSPGAG